MPSVSFSPFSLPSSFLSFSLSLFHTSPLPLCIRLFILHPVSLCPSISILQQWTTQLTSWRLNVTQRARGAFLWDLKSPRFWHAVGLQTGSLTTVDLGQEYLETVRFSLEMQGRTGWFGEPVEFYLEIASLRRSERWPRSVYLALLYCPIPS